MQHAFPGWCEHLCCDLRAHGSCHALRQIEKYNEYAQLKRKLVLRTSSLRGALAINARAELPRPLAPGEQPMRAIDEPEP